MHLAAHNPLILVEQALHLLGVLEPPVSLPSRTDAHLEQIAPDCRPLLLRQVLNVIKPRYLQIRPRSCAPSHGVHPPSCYSAALKLPLCALSTVTPAHHLG